MSKFLESNIVYFLKQVSNEPNNVHVVLAPTEADAQKTEQTLIELSRGIVEANDVDSMPGFVQAGVFRFESARRIMAKRLRTLCRLKNRLPKILVCSVQGWSRFAPTLEWMTQFDRTLRIGDAVDQEEFLSDLEWLGYSQLQKVEEVGEFAVRGAIVDVFSPAHKSPLRVEFFGDNIEKIRLFRSADQRSFENLEMATLLPAREFVWPTSIELEHAIESFNSALLQFSVTGHGRSDLLEHIRSRVPFPGIDDACLEFAQQSYTSFATVLSTAAKAHRTNADVKLYSLHEPAALLRVVSDTIKLYDDAAASGFGKNFLSVAASKVFPEFKTIEPTVGSAIALLNEPDFVIPPSLRSPVQLPKLADRANWVASVLEQGDVVKHVLLLSKSIDNLTEFCSVTLNYFKEFESTDLSKVTVFNGQDLFSTHLKAARISERFYAAFAETEGMFYLPTSQTLVVSQRWLQGIVRDDSFESFASDESAQATRAATDLLMATQFGEFSEGDLVVHVQHGIAKFRGLATIAVGGIPHDFLALEFANNDRIYVPIHKMNLVQRYMGAAAAGNAAVDSLRGSSWEKRKERAKVDAEKMARELIDHKAKHAASGGHAFAKIDEDYLAFEAAFPFDETPDQQRATREIMGDMSKPKSMDRVLCGDVGFGKTEVAMRAAFRAVLDGKQVAWLVPTTILAHQHYRSLIERFKEFNVNVETFDRLHTAKSMQTALERLEQGKIDIAVGTHRLLSKDIKFRDLGLLIIDEEHRFGVLQKEKIKTLAYGIDELAMTATPIPRTLQMAMLGIRDLSLLTTPPKARLAVKTFVAPFDDTIVKSAIESELARGGQVFYVHNRVEDLPAVEQFLKGMLPQLRIDVGHGKMAQKDLEKKMMAFLDGQLDVLVCTTIIESGIDMPNVNTIIVQNADHFGLSQLYQLRGRVGRRSSRGFAYFLSSNLGNEDKDGVKRLEILKEHQDLGSGFVIASQDLEMRGAGNVLGDEQSGFVSEVGLETYLQMLDDAVKSLGGVRVTPITDVEIQVPLVTQIPDGYIENARERLRVYRRFFGARNEDALQALLTECEDRFGPIPDSVSNLAELSRLRRWLLSFGAVTLTVGDEYTEIRLSRELIQPSNNDETSERLIKRLLDVCNRFSKGMRLTPDGRLLIGIRKKQIDPLKPSTALTELKKYLSLLAGEGHGAALS